MIVKTNNITINDIHCIEYHIKITKNDFKSSYDLVKEIENTIPNNEQIIFSDFKGIKYSEIVPQQEFRIRTKKKEILEKENKIKSILIENGFEFYDEEEKNNHTVQFYKDWIELEFINTPGKESIDKLSKIFNIKDWLFDFNDWDGTIKLLLKGELL